MMSFGLTIHWQKMSCSSGDSSRASCCSNSGTWSHEIAVLRLSRLNRMTASAAVVGRKLIFDSSTKYSLLIPFVVYNTKSFALINPLIERVVFHGIDPAYWSIQYQVCRVFSKLTGAHRVDGIHEIIRVVVLRKRIDRIFHERYRAGAWIEKRYFGWIQLVVVREAER